MKAPRELPAEIEVLDGLDPAELWDRFEIFEALHHSMQICNPMTDHQLDELVAGLAVSGGDRMLDIACGPGELLIRAEAVAAIDGTGIDMSPWMLSRAVACSRQVGSGSGLRWILGHARDFAINTHFDIVTCLGAEWIWHGFNGTARAVAARTRVGGRVAIGAARLHHGADADAVARRAGRIETADEMQSMLVAHGLQPIDRLDPDDSGWDAYLARTSQAASDWALAHPGDTAERWRNEQRDWQEARERDRDIIGWSVWIARRVP